jgi:hypothetical protein
MLRDPSSTSPAAPRPQSANKARRSRLRLVKLEERIAPTNVLSPGGHGGKPVKHFGGVV